MRIIWKEWAITPSVNDFGHGVHFHDCRRPADADLVAWLEGYKWLHAKPKIVTIWCIAPDDITTQDVIGEMQKAIEIHVKNNRLPCGRIATNIDAWPNT
ncbi:MAG: hypothetical protein ACOYOS_24120 [Syntrophales bacterium]